MNIILKMKRIKDLSPSERQIVNYIISNPKAICDMGIVELAQKTYTSTSTILRVCKKLDMNSYTDFRIHIARDTNEYLENAVLLKNELPIIPTDTLSTTIEKVTNNNMRAILDAKELNSIESINNIIMMMTSATQLDFYGSGISNLICQDAMLKALRLGISSTSYSYNVEMSMLAKTCSKTHLAFIISYTGKTQEIIKIAQILNKRSIPSVSITSHTDNILLDLCNINLFVENYESIFRIGGMSSRLSIQHVLDILFAGYMNYNYDKIKNIVKKTFDNDIFFNPSTNK